MFVEFKNGFPTTRYFYLDNLFKQCAPFPWKNFTCANDINNKDWIAGTAENIYGEQHAVLLIPTPAI